MAWTAKFSRFDADSNVVQAEFTDGVRVVQRTLPVPPGITSPAAASAWLKLQAGGIIAQLVSKDTLSAAVPDTDITPAPEPPPDPDQTTKDTFIANVRLLAQLQKAVAIGLVQANDSRLTTLQSNMQSQFNALTQAQQLKVINIL
jgi:hypothetical protein